MFTLQGGAKYQLENVKVGSTLTISEKAAKGWTPNVTTNAGTQTLKPDIDGKYTVEVTPGMIITFTNVQETIEVSGSKTWDDAEDQDGKRPDYITIQLYADGQKIDSQTVSAEDGWAWRFENLPKYKEGELINYIIHEDNIPGYTPSYNGYNITNSYTPGKVSIPVIKSWQDQNDQDGIRPEFVKVKLFADNKDIGKTLILNEENGWRGIFSGLDEYDDGNKINYTIKEISVDGYNTTISGNASKGFTITNTHTPETTEVCGSKTWDDADNQDGKRPDYITIRLYADGELKDTATVTAKDGWKWKFTELPKYADGDVIKYTITEDTVDGYTPTYTDFNIINTHTPDKISVTVKKIWNDADDQDRLRPAEVTVKLLANGKDTGKSITLSKANRWIDIFTGLDEYKDGQKIVYTVEEVSVDGYDSVITGDAATGFVITNSHTTAEIDLSGSKTWDDADNQDGQRPNSITIRLYADGQEIDSQTVSAKDGWAWRFENLPKYKNGKEIRYTITEDMIPGYQSEVDGMNVINHYTPGQINILVTKSWQDQDDADGIRPDSIIVKLYANGKDTGEKLVLDQKNNWMGSFDNLDEYADGVKIMYTISEVEVDGYDTAIGGSAETGFVICNSHTPDTPDEPDIPDKPEQPQNPGQPENPDTPETGDTTNLDLWIGILMIAGAGMTAIFVLGKKKRYCRKHTK